MRWCKERCANFRVPRYLRIVENFESIGMTAEVFEGVCTDLPPARKR